MERERRLSNAFTSHHRRLDTKFTTRYLVLPATDGPVYSSIASTAPHLILTFVCDSPFVLGSASLSSDRRCGLQTKQQYSPTWTLPLLPVSSRALQARRRRRRPSKTMRDTTPSPLRRSRSRLRRACLRSHTPTLLPRQQRTSRMSVQDFTRIAMRPTYLARDCDRAAFGRAKEKRP